MKDIGCSVDAISKTLTPSGQTLVPTAAAKPKQKRKKSEKKEKVKKERKPRKEKGVYIYVITP